MNLKEVSGFLPNHYELLEVVKHWAAEVLMTELGWLETGQAGGRETRIRAFALSRISQIRDVIGNEDVDQAIDKVHAKFQEGTDPQFWGVFLHGDEAQRRAIREETWAKLDEIVVPPTAEQVAKALDDIAAFPEAVNILFKAHQANMNPRLDDKTVFQISRAGELFKAVQKDEKQNRDTVSQKPRGGIPRRRPMTRNETS